jgi:hypothetical protein
VIGSLAGLAQVSGSREWNVNSSYDYERLNLLIPSPDTHPFPRSCQLPDDFPRCEARPTYRTIICNPSFARELTRIELHPGAFRPEMVVAGRFMALILLGHELAHLEANRGPAPRGFSPALAQGELRCFDRRLQLETTDVSEEEWADQRGMKLACDALRQDPVLQYLPAKLGSSLEVRQLARSVLDSQYFRADDTCVPTREYPSLGRRKHDFVGDLLACLYQDEETLTRTMARDDRQAFEKLEAELLTRQKDGFAAAMPYGKHPTLSQEVVLGQDQRVLSLHSASAHTVLTAVDIARRRPGNGTYLALREWNLFTRLVFVRSEGGSARLLLEQDTPERGTRWSALRVQCRPAGGTTPCTAADESSVIESARPVSLVSAPGGALLALSEKGIALFRNEAHLAKELHQAPFTRNCPVAPYSLAAASSAQLAAAFSFSKSGMFTADVLDQGTPLCTWVEFPQDTKELVAFALEGDQAFFLIHRSSRDQLLVCPSSLLTERPRARARCTAFTVPPVLLGSSNDPTGDVSAYSIRLLPRVPGCGNSLSVSAFGRTWILEHLAPGARADLLPANGLAGCMGPSSLVTHRAGRIDLFGAPEWGEPPVTELLDVSSLVFVGKKPKESGR